MNQMLKSKKAMDTATFVAIVIIVIVILISIIAISKSGSSMNSLWDNSIGKLLP